MPILFQILRFGHILAVVFMAWPLYALIAVNERGRLGSPVGEWADKYMENIIKAQTIRCYVYQLTAAVTGIAIVLVRGLGLSSIITHWVLATKTVLLLALMGLLSFVHFGLQPRIDAFFAQIGAGPVPPDLGAQVGPLRSRRKKLASVCLLLVITTILLVLQPHLRRAISVNACLGPRNATSLVVAPASLLSLGPSPVGPG